MNRLSQLHYQFSRSGERPFFLKLIVLLLIPASWLYAKIMWCRRRIYVHGWKRTYRSRLPVLSVGNLAVGGTGKTPTVDWLVRRFQQQGKRPAIVSRGYAGRHSGAVTVVSDGHQIFTSATVCGDEPLLLARRNPTCPVVVSKKRSDGVLKVEQSFDVDLIILDDAFQHLKMSRDFDLVLLDATDPFGNGWTLPAGRLREGVDALASADVLLVTRAEARQPSPCPQLPSFFSSHRLADTAIGLDGEIMLLSELAVLRIFAFAGIAEPDRFFHALGQVGLTLKKMMALPDHVKYSSEIIADLNLASMECDLLLTTEKDSVKLTADMFKLPCYSVGLELDMTNGSELMKIINQKIWRTS